VKASHAFMAGFALAIAVIGVVTRIRLPGEIDRAVRREVDRAFTQSPVLNAIRPQAQTLVADMASRVARDAAMGAIPV